MSKWAQWPLRSPASPLFIRVQIKENIKAPRHCLRTGNSPGTCELPAQMASNAENVSIWWRHHGIRCDAFDFDNLSLTSTKLQKGFSIHIENRADSRLCSQPLRDVVTKYRHLSLAGHKPRMSPEIHPTNYWQGWFSLWCLLFWYHLILLISFRVASSEVG